MDYTEMSKGKRRFWTIINILSLFIFAGIFQMYILFGLGWTYLISAVGVFLVIAVSFYYAFGKTGLWRFTHRSLDKFDEREMHLTANATRMAYSVYTIFTLSLFLILSIFGVRVSIVLVVSLIYLAHILPACIIGFK